MKYSLELKNYWSSLMGISEDEVPQGCLSCAVDSERHRVYLWGQSDLKAGLKPLWIYDMVNATIRSVDFTDPAPRMNHRMFVLNDGRLCIVGGSPADHDADSRRYLDEILIMDPSTLKTEALSLPGGLLNRGQIAASIDPSANRLYLFGGFSETRNGLDWFHCVDLSTGECLDLKPSGDSLPGRAGSVMAYLPDGKIFIFSGFSEEEGRPVCHHDYFLYDPVLNHCKRFVLQELLGRSFAGSALDLKREIVLLFGGTHNGFETNGFFLAYHYGRNALFPLPLQSLPGNRMEAAFFIDPVNDRAVIAGGLEMDGLEGYRPFREMMALDLSALDSFV